MAKGGMERAVHDLKFEEEQYAAEIENERLLIQDLDKQVVEMEKEIKWQQDNTSSLEDSIKSHHRQFTINRENVNSLKKAMDVLPLQLAALDSELALKRNKNHEAISKLQGRVNDYEKELQRWMDGCNMFPLAQKRLRLQQILHTVSENAKDAAAKRDSYLVQLEKKNTANDMNAEYYMDINQFIVRLAQLNIECRNLSKQNRSKDIECEEKKNKIAVDEKRIEKEREMLVVKENAEKERIEKEREKANKERAEQFEKARISQVTAENKQAVNVSSVVSSQIRCQMPSQTTLSQLPSYRSIPRILTQTGFRHQTPKILTPPMMQTTATTATRPRIQQPQLFTSISRGAAITTLDSQAQRSSLTMHLRSPQSKVPMLQMPKRMTGPGAMRQSQAPQVHPYRVATPKTQPLTASMPSSLGNVRTAVSSPRPAASPATPKSVSEQLDSRSRIQAPTSNLLKTPVTHRESSADSPSSLPKTPPNSQYIEELGTSPFDAEKHQRRLKMIAASSPGFKWTSRPVYDTDPPSNTTTQTQAVSMATKPQEAAGNPFLTSFFDDKQQKPRKEVTTEEQKAANISEKSWNSPTFNFSSGDKPTNVSTNLFGSPADDKEETDTSKMFNFSGGGDADNSSAFSFDLAGDNKSKGAGSNIFSMFGDAGSDSDTNDQHSSFFSFEGRGEEPSTSQNFSLF